jgi:dUTP pyrophosphatase
MNLKIKTFSEDIHSMYNDHRHFHQGDAGLDLFIIKDKIIESGVTDRIHLGISCENLEQKPYLLMARSSISKTPLRLSNSVGLIDAGYRGEIMAAVDNIKDYSYTVEKGQRLFQLVSMSGEAIHFTLVDRLSDTSRGDGGFGSTGK